MPALCRTVVQYTDKRNICSYLTKVFCHSIAKEIRSKLIKRCVYVVIINAENKLLFSFFLEIKTIYINYVNWLSKQLSLDFLKARPRF